MPTIKYEAVMELVRLVLDIRDEYRNQGNFQAADALRQRLEAISVIIEDTKNGSRGRLSRQFQNPYTIA